MIPIRAAWWVCQAAALVLALGAFVACDRRVEAVQPARFRPPPFEPSSQAAPRLASASPQRESGPLALLAGSGSLYLALADEDARALRVFDATTHASLVDQPSSCAPHQLIATSDGSLFVSEPGCNRVRHCRVLVDADGARVVELGQLEVAVEPVALALTPDESRLLVLSAWGRTLQTFSLPDLAALASVELGREPRAVTTTDDGRRAFISHALGSTVTEVDLGKGRALTHSIGTRTATPARRFHRLWEFEPFFFAGGPHLPRRPGFSASVASALHATQGFSIVQRGGRVLVPSVLSNPGEAGQRASGYGAVGSPLPATLQDVVTLDVASGRSNRRGTFAIIDGWSHASKNVCRLPRAAAYDERRDGLLVACQGTDRVIEFDALARDPARTELRSFAVPRGPAGIVLTPDSRRAHVWSRFARSLSVLQLDAEPPARPPETSTSGERMRRSPTPAGRVLASFPVTDDARVDRVVLAGMERFHAAGDPRISRDGRACASCHPAGRDDGLSWRTGDALAARQTPMLDGRIEGTAPYGWLGQHATLEQHLGNTVKHRLGGTGLDPRAMADLASYLRALPGPRVPEPPRTEAVERGRTLFHSADVGCGDCHEADGGVDGLQYAVAGRVATDTPSLRFVAGSAPFFHDGKFGDLEALLVHTSGTMGQPVPLGPAERAALVAFLETL